MEQSFKDYIDLKFNLNEGEGASFRNMHKKATPEEQEKIDIAKGREVKQKEPTIEENPVVTNIKKKIDILYKNYGELGLKLVDSSIIKSYQKLKKILSSMDGECCDDSNDVEPQQTQVQQPKPVKKVIKKKPQQVIKKKVIVVKEEDDDEEVEVMSDNEDKNTATNQVANSLPNVFPDNNQVPSDDEDDEEIVEVEDDNDEEEVEKVEEKPKKKKKEEKNESKKVRNMNDDELADMFYEKSVEYTNEHAVVENFDDIPDFMGDEPLNEHTTTQQTTITQSAPQTIQRPSMDMDSITGDDMDAFADQFC